MNSDTEYLYHISMRKTATLFVPRIPKGDSRAINENSKKKRICMSTSIENCLGAFPDTNFLSEALCDEKIFGIPLLIYVFRIKKDLVKPKHIIKPYVLFKKNWVQDSLYTQEHWIVKRKVQFEEPNIIYIRDISLKSIQVPNYGTILKVLDLRYENNIENNDREYIYTFVNKKDKDKFKKIINDIGYIIHERRIEKSKSYLVHFIVNANEDNAPLWQEYETLRCQYTFKLDSLDFEMMNSAVENYIKSKAKKSHAIA